MGLIDTISRTVRGKREVDIPDGDLRGPGTTAVAVQEPPVIAPDRPDLQVVQRGNDPLADYISRHMSPTGEPETWSPSTYGDYMATSVPVYRAVKLRADAVASAPMKVYLTDPQGELQWVGPDHPVQHLLDNVNSIDSHADMWTAVETYLSLWGSSFRWVNKVVESDPRTWEIWPLRPDRVKVLVGSRQEPVRGFVYDPNGANFPMLADEVIWDRYFNPLDEYAGLSPLAAGRLSMDMQKDMLKTNRQMFKNGVLAQNLAFFLNGPLKSSDLEAFYHRLEERHGSPDVAGRPFVIDKAQGDVKNLGFSNRDMEYANGLTFALQDAARIYGVPPTLLFDMSQSIYNNVSEARADFYGNAVTQEWGHLKANMQENFVPMLGPAGEGLTLAFDLSDVQALQEHQTAVAERDRADVTAGLKTINEVRGERGEEPVPWGDEWWAPMGLRPVISGSVATPAAEGEIVEGSIVRVDGPVNRALTAAVTEKAWTNFVRRVEEDEKDFAKLQNKLFNAQAKAVKEAIPKALRLIDVDEIFDEEEWGKAFREVGGQVYSKIMDRSAKAQVGEFALGIDFDVNQATPQNWIYEREKFWAERVNKETARLITDEIATANAEGETITQIQKRVSRVFGMSKEFRTERIARTETVSAANEGHVQAYLQANVAQMQWVTTLDDRTREGHADADGQVVDVGKGFYVDGEVLRAPGDGSAYNAINCRCTTIPLVTA
tara:strand:+ start:506 stop:2662 length:2157 start_codon:yes stop_codon:yes gene_type:complete